MKAGLVSKRSREDVGPQHLNQKQNLMVTQSYLNHLGFCNHCSSITLNKEKHLQILIKTQPPVQVKLDVCYNYS